MIFQYAIDWDSLKIASGKTDEELLCRQLLGLATLVQRNGCLVRTGQVSDALEAWRLSLPQGNDVKVCSLQHVLSDWSNLYKDRSLDVEKPETRARDFKETVSAWKDMLKDAGLELGRKDPRFILIFADKCAVAQDFFSVIDLKSAVEQLDRETPKWARLQHYPTGVLGRREFTRYVEAFSASADGTVRLFDPYLLDAMLPVLNDKRVKAWRNSLYYFMQVFMANNRIDTIDIVTTETKECKELLNRGGVLLVDELMSDILIRAFMQRRKNLALRIHIVDKGREFHDRLLANGRGCFAIGHGLDICETGASYEKLCTRFERHEQVQALEWRNMPQACDLTFATFNVYFGCMRNQIPAGLTVFNSSEIWSEESHSFPMYPQGCGASRYSEERLVARFACGAYRSGCLLVKNNPIRKTRLEVRINQFEDNF